MPEGPEIKFLRDCLNDLVKNKELIKIKINKQKFKDSLFDNPNNSKAKINEICLNVKHHGKKILFILETKFIVSSLAMNGHWSVDKVQDYDIKIYFEGINLYFKDKDSYSEFIMYDIDYLDEYISTFGPDISKISYDEFLRIINKFKHEQLCYFLVNQKAIAGIGNYMRSEILYLCKLDPFVYIRDLTEENIKDIYLYSRQVYKTSYKSGGFTLATYKDIYGNKGNYKPLIYGKSTAKKIYDKYKRVIYLEDN